MKKTYYIFGALVIISFLITGIFLAFMPDQIPIHYNLLGEVDRIGSKYENLLVPTLATISGLVLIAIAKSKKRTDSEKKILSISAVCISTFINALGIFFMCKELTYSFSESSAILVETTKFVTMGIGVILIILGNIMPKARKNAIFGLRTTWSMYNDTVWQKSQRFAGFSSVICGFLMIIIAIFLSGVWNLVASALLILLWVAICIIVSYKYYKVEKND